MMEHMSGEGLVGREGRAGAEGEKKVERRKAKKKKQGGRGQQQQGEKEEDGAMVRTRVETGGLEQQGAGAAVGASAAVVMLQVTQMAYWGDALSFCLCQGVAEAGEGAGAPPAPSPASGYSTTLLHDAIIAGQVVLHHARAGHHFASRTLHKDCLSPWSPF